MFLEFNDNNFDSLVPVNLTIIDFWSPWCGPCNKLNPIIKNIAEKNPDITIGKINVQENGKVAGRFNINAIPTIIFLKEGKVVKRILGFQTHQQLQKLIDDLK